MSSHADRWRPQHLTASGELFVPAVYNTPRLGTRSTVSFLPPAVDADVEPARLDPHGGIIRSGVRRAKLEARACQLLADERPFQSRTIGRAASGYSPGCPKASTISVPGGSSPG